jgi:hypothetical protein
MQSIRRCREPTMRTLVTVSENGSHARLILGPYELRHALFGSGFDMTAGVILGLMLGVVASVATHAGWLIKHRGAQRSPVMEHRHPWRSVRSLFTSRAFAIGMLVATMGGLLHLFALALAPILVVQAVMAIGLVPLAIVASAVLADHCRAASGQGCGAPGWDCCCSRSPCPR